MWWRNLWTRWQVEQRIETATKPWIIERPWLLGGGFDVFVPNYARRYAWFRERINAEMYVSLIVQMAENPQSKQIVAEELWSKVGDGVKG